MCNKNVDDGDDDIEVNDVYVDMDILIPLMVSSRGMYYAYSLCNSRPPTHTIHHRPYPPTTTTTTTTTHKAYNRSSISFTRHQFYSPLHYSSASNIETVRCIATLLFVVIIFCVYQGLFMHRITMK